MRVSLGYIGHTCWSVTDGSLACAPPAKPQITEPNSRDQKSYPTCHTWPLFCSIQKIAFILHGQHSSCTVATYQVRFLALHVRDQCFIPLFTTNMDQNMLATPTDHTIRHKAFHFIPTCPTENKQCSLVWFEYPIALLSSIRQCSLVNSYQLFEGVCCHPLQRRSQSKQSAIVTTAILCFIPLRCKFGQTVQLRLSAFSLVGPTNMLLVPSSAVVRSTITSSGVYDGL